MGEVRPGVARDVTLELVPTAVRVADSFTKHANPQQAAKVRQLAFSGLIDGFLRLHALGHVDAASDITSELPVLTEIRAAPVENPAVLAVVTPQAVVHLKHFTP